MGKHMNPPLPLPTRGPDWQILIMGVIYQRERDRGIKNMEPPEEPDPKDHPLYKKVYELSFSIHKWLEENKPGIPEPEVVDVLPEDKVIDPRFKEALEVIYFYNFFISAKIYRALGGIGDFETDEIQTDSNGSAKIALIAIDRLIAVVKKKETWRGKWPGITIYS